MESKKVEFWTDDPPDKMRRRSKYSSKLEKRYRSQYNRRRELGIQPRGWRCSQFYDNSEFDQRDKPSVQASRTETQQHSLLRAHLMRQYPAKSTRMSLAQKTKAAGVTKTRKKSLKTQLLDTDIPSEEINLPYPAQCPTIEPVIELEKKFGEYGKLSIADTPDITHLPEPDFSSEIPDCEPSMGSILALMAPEFGFQSDPNTFRFESEDAGKPLEKDFDAPRTYTTSLKKKKMKKAASTNASVVLKKEIKDGGLNKESIEFVSIPMEFLPETSIKKECDELEIHTETDIHIETDIHTETDIHDIEMLVDVDLTNPNVNEEYETIIVNNIKKEHKYVPKIKGEIDTDNDTMSIVHIDNDALNNLRNNSNVSVEIEVPPISISSCQSNNSTREAYTPRWIGKINNIFDGKRKLNWLKFMKEYRQKVFSKTSVCDAEKYFLLFTHLEGEPKKLCEHLPMQGSSLQLAIDILKSKYCRRTVVDANIKRMFKLTTVDDESRVLEDLLNPVLKIRDEFKRFSLYWDPMLMEVVLSKLPQHLRDGFEEEFGGLGEEPIFTDLIVFLQNKCKKYSNCLYLFERN